MLQLQRVVWWSGVWSACASNVQDPHSAGAAAVCCRSWHARQRRRGSHTAKAPQRRSVPCCGGSAPRRRSWGDEVGETKDVGGGGRQAARNGEGGLSTRPGAMHDCGEYLCATATAAASCTLSTSDDTRRLERTRERAVRRVREGEREGGRKKKCACAGPLPLTRVPLRQGATDCSFGCSTQGLLSRRQLAVCPWSLVDHSPRGAEHRTGTLCETQRSGAISRAEYLPAAVCKDGQHVCGSRGARGMTYSQMLGGSVELAGCLHACKHRTRTDKHANILSTYLHAQIHTCSRHEYIRAHFHLPVCIFINVYIHTYMHTHKQTHIQTYKHTYIHTYTHTYIHTYIYTYMHTYIHTYIHTCTHTCMHTYIHTYNQTYIHTYIQKKTCIVT